MKSSEFQSVLRLIGDEEDKIFVTKFLGEQLPLQEIMIIYFFFKNPAEFKKFKKSNRVNEDFSSRRQQIFSSDYFRLFIEHLFEPTSIYEHRLIAIDGNFEIILGFKTSIVIHNRYQETYSEEFRRLGRIAEEVYQIAPQDTEKIYHQYCL